MLVLWSNVKITPALEYQAPEFITPQTRNETVASARVLLAGNGKALLPIVIAINASQSTRDVAADLARVLEKMTGAKFEVQTGDGKRGIVLGSIREFPDGELETIFQPLVAADDREAFAIRTSPARVLLIGKSDVGAGDAAYRFLHELGCRWLSPAPNWEIIPSRNELEWNRNITDRPDIQSRRISYSIANPENRALYFAWRRRNLHNSALQIGTGHAWDQIINANQAEFNAHPEYYPLINGERMTKSERFKTAVFNTVVQPDIGNPAVRKMFVTRALEYFRKNPEADMVSVEPNDGGKFSSSPEFQALGSISDAVFGLANEVARAVAKEFPGKMVGVLAYREHADPPSFKLEPNVYVQITSALFSKFSREELVEMWVQKASNLGFYEYYMPYEWSLDQLPGGNAASLKYIERSVKDSVSRKASSIDGQGSGGWFLNGRGYWIAAQLMWNSQQDAEALNTDYLQSAFGPAAETMRHFYDLWNPDNGPVVSKNLVYQMALELQQAEAEAGDRPDVLARLNDIKGYLRFLQLDWTLQSLHKSEPYEIREKAFVDLFTHLWRTSSTRMNETELAQQNLFQQRGEQSGIILVEKGKPKTLVNPALSSRTSGGKPVVWKNTTPYAPSEIESNWRSTLEYFKSDPINTKMFSRDLIPIDWEPGQAPGLPTSTETALYTQGGTRHFGLYSFNGEPIEIGLASSADKKMSWVLQDANGDVISQGEVQSPVSDETVKLKIPVPRAGGYFIDARSTGGFLRVAIDGKLPAVIALQRGELINQVGPSQFQQPRCFYVPKGTREFQVYAFFAANTPKVIAPDGKVVMELRDVKSFATVTVPAGMDGKVWRVDAGIRQFWLAGVPPFVAASPERLLVPRDLAKLDGLSIRQKNRIL